MRPIKVLNLSDLSIVYKLFKETLFFMFQYFCCASREVLVDYSAIISF